MIEEVHTEVDSNIEEGLLKGRLDYGTTLLESFREISLGNKQNYIGRWKKLSKVYISEINTCIEYFSQMSILV